MTTVRRSLARSRIPLVIAFAAIAAMLVAAVLVGDGGRPSAPRHADAPVERVVQPAEPGRDASVADIGGTSSGTSTAALAKGMSAEAVAPATGVVDAPSSLPAPSIEQRIARTASIRLRTRRGAFEDAWGEAQAVARASGGFVVSSSRSGGGDSARTAMISMRVPSARFDAAVAELRRVTGTKVERLDIASQDVGQEYVDTSSRLRHDRAVEARMLTLLAATKSVSEVLAVQARLDRVQEAIEVSAGRIKYLDSVTSMSTIDVTLRIPARAGDSAADDDSPLGEALRDAGSRFVERVSDGIIWIGGALPALIVVGFALLAARSWMRRYRAR